jgi:hypothetical protein
MAAKLAPLKQSPPNSRIWHRGSAAPNSESKISFAKLNFQKMTCPPNLLHFQKIIFLIDLIGSRNLQYPAPN